MINWIKSLNNIQGHSQVSQTNGFVGIIRFFYKTNLKHNSIPVFILTSENDK